ncbi:MAG: hypothetical protein P4L85_17655 [Paludisphaera borealis]|uniref:hypothetical protein n=1 Tax=Paludisphaera borealis TaxID=1387353 RepID=UPI00284EBEA1|nr:hypothetical protein [Paludisphaera borealis]MDR3621182.1 hypothetical protein [Paludisphaera borealis]
MPIPPAAWGVLGAGFLGVVWLTPFVLIPISEIVLAIIFPPRRWGKRLRPYFNEVCRSILK